MQTKLENVAIVDQQITNDGETIFFKIEKVKDDSHGGLLGPNGLPVGMG
jgi:hypothetical protein